MRKTVRIISLILCLLMLVYSFPLNAFADDGTGDTTTSTTAPAKETTTQPTTKKKIKPKKTVVKNMPEVINKKADKKASFKITVSPANPRRVVKLQLYNSKKKKYKTVKTYKTKKADTAKLKITIPDKYRKKTTGKWRIVISKSKTGKKCVKKFKVVTSNLQLLGLNAKAACIYCVDTGYALYDKKMN